MKSIRKQKKAHKMAARPLIKQIKSYGYKFDYDVYATYFIWNFDSNGCNLHITFKEIPDIKFGIWKQNNTIQYFAEDILFIDKFKPTRCYFGWDTLEEMMEFVGKCINDKNYYKEQIIKAYYDDDYDGDYDDSIWQERLDEIEEMKFKENHNFFTKEEYVKNYNKFQNIIKNLNTEKFIIVWHKADCLYKLYDVWFYTTNLVTTEEAQNFYKELVDCKCDVFDTCRLPKDFWTKKRSRYNYRINPKFKKLFENKNYYLKLFNFQQYK